MSKKKKPIKKVTKLPVAPKKKAPKRPGAEKKPDELTKEELIAQNEQLRKSILEAANLIAGLKATIVSQSMQISGVLKSK